MVLETTTTTDQNSAKHLNDYEIRPFATTASNIRDASVAGRTTHQKPPNIIISVLIPI